MRGGRIGWLWIEKEYDWLAGIIDLMGEKKGIALF